MKENMNEKRKFSRVAVDTIVMYQTENYPITEDKDAHKVDTPMNVDLSEGGLQIKTNQKLNVNEKLQIVLSIVGTKVPMQINGKVVWVKPAEQANTFYIGIEFVDFNDKAKKDLIRNYVLNLKK